MIDVLIVEDQPIAQYFYKKEFEGSNDYNVVSYASNGFEAIEMYKEERPNIVIMDIQMMGCGGIRASKKILRIDKDAKIIVVTTSISKYYLITLKLMGVKCFVYRGDMIKNKKYLFEAMEQSVDNTFYLSDSFDELSFDLIGDKKEMRFDVLTPTEFDVLYMLGSGMDANSISVSMNVLCNVVYTYKKRAVDKLGIGSIDEFVELASKDYGIVFMNEI